MSMMSSLMLHNSMRRDSLKEAVDLIIKGRATISSVEQKGVVVWRYRDRILAKDSENNLSEVIDAKLGVSRWYWRAVS
jgi:hypothetical protein